MYEDIIDKYKALYDAFETEEEKEAFDDGWTESSVNNGLDFCSFPEGLLKEAWIKGYNFYKDNASLYTEYYQNKIKKVKKANANYQWI